jgi:hypothetical protein
MRRIPVEAKRVDAFGSVGVTEAALARSDKVDGAEVDVRTFEPGGLRGIP